MKKIVFASWDDAPHLTEKMKEAQLEGMDPHLRDARTRGIPFLGAGAVYKVLTETFEVKPFPIPANWPRAFGMDVGWNRTAAVWGALDQNNDILYLYDEHYAGEEVPSVHANAIMGFGTKNEFRAPWIPGAIDPASKGRSQIDGQMLIESYRKLGLNLEMAANAVDTGIHEVWLRLSSGRLKVFSNLSYFFKEFLLYRRDSKGKIIKKNDHLMDATRYLVMTGLERSKPVPAPSAPVAYDYAYSGNGWMSS